MYPSAGEQLNIGELLKRHGEMVGMDGRKKTENTMWLFSS
jgi:hypothetical protein